MPEVTMPIEISHAQALGDVVYSVQNQSLPFISPANPRNTETSGLLTRKAYAEVFRLFQPLLIRLMGFSHWIFSLGLLIGCFGSLFARALPSCESGGWPRGFGPQNTRFPA